MTERSDKWKSREWYGTTKTRWQQPAGSSGGQSSADTWEQAKPKGKWIEVYAVYEVLDALVKCVETGLGLVAKLLGAGAELRMSCAFGTGKFGQDVVRNMMSKWECRNSKDGWDMR